MTSPYLIAAAARANLMNDTQMEWEHKAQQRLSEAITAMREAIKSVNGLSGCVTIDAQTFEDWVHDECPSTDFWDERIGLKRNGLT